MVSFTLTYDKDVIDALKSNIANAPKTMTTFVEKTLPDLLEKDLAPLKTEPRLPTLPFIWSYDPVKQRKAARYYFGVKLRGKKGIGGRHIRTHELVNNWKIIAGKIRDGSILTVSNATPGLDYVQGPSQVPSHHDSGWHQYDEILLKIEEKANDLVIDTWYNVLIAPQKGSKFA